MTPLCFILIGWASIPTLTIRSHNKRLYNQSSIYSIWICFNLPKVLPYLRKYPFLSYYLFSLLKPHRLYPNNNPCSIEKGREKYDWIDFLLLEISKHGKCFERILKLTKSMLLVGWFNKIGYYVVFVKQTYNIREGES